MHNFPTATELSSEKCAGVRQLTSHRQDVIMSFSRTITPYSDTVDSVDSSPLLQTGDNSYSPSRTSCSVAVSRSGELYIIQQTVH